MRTIDQFNCDVAQAMHREKVEDAAFSIGVDADVLDCFWEESGRSEVRPLDKRLQEVHRWLNP